MEREFHRDKLIKQIAHTAAEMCVDPWCACRRLRRKEFLPFAEGFETRPPPCISDSWLHGGGHVSVSAHAIFGFGTARSMHEAEVVGCQLSSAPLSRGFFAFLGLSSVL